MQRCEALLGVIATLHYRIARNDLGISCGCLPGPFLNDFGFGGFSSNAARWSVNRLADWARPELRDLTFIILTQIVERFIGSAISRLSVYQGPSSRDRHR